jgi:hypothetical protein
MASFFNAERIQAGWRFFLLWLIMTLLGLGIGAAIEFFVFKGINGNIAVIFASIAQAWVLNRHISIYIPWAVSAMATWWIVALIVWPLVGMMRVQNPYIPLAIVALLAGLLAGALHYFFMKEWLPVGVWWIAVAAFSWLSLGIIPGIVLTIILSREAIAMDGRWFELSEPAA